MPDVRRNEILRLLEAGLEDISVSRAGQSWGIPMPQDPSSVVYVWFDALINYISAVGLGTDDALLAKWWPADLHVIGKDITRFHSVIWPAMLMSAGVALPRQVFGHGWVHLKGEKMSKSLGTAVEPLEALDRFGPDPLRLYLIKEITFGSDGDFSWERYEDRYNVDLANNLGNLVSRIAAMAEKYRDGTLAASGSAGRLAGVAGEARGRLPAGDGRVRDRARRRGGVSDRRRGQRVHREHRAVGASRATPRAPASCRRCCSTSPKRFALPAILLLPVMPRRRPRSCAAWARPGRPAVCSSRDAAWQNDGTRQITKARPCGRARSTRRRPPKQ